MPVCPRGSLAAAETRRIRGGGGKPYATNGEFSQHTTAPARSAVLFVAQRDQRIDTRGAPCGEPAGPRFTRLRAGICSSVARAQRPL
jgi:hypothetical protein